MADTDTDSPPDPIKKMRADILFSGCAGRWRKVRREIEEWELTDMGYWQTAPGCAVLRELAFRAVQNKNLEMLKYFIETIHVPGHGLFEIEKAETGVVNQCLFTPFTSLYFHLAYEGMDEILAYLLSLPPASVEVGCRLTDDGIPINLLHQFVTSVHGLEVVRHLVLERGMDVCELDGNGHLPIYRAVVSHTHCKDTVEIARFLYEQHKIRGQSYTDIHRLMPEGVSLLGEALKVEFDVKMLRFLVEEMGGGEGKLSSRYTGFDYLAAPHFAALYFENISALEYLLMKVPLDMQGLEDCIRYTVSHAISQNEENKPWLYYLECFAERLGPDSCRSMKESLDLNTLKSSCPDIFQFFDECKYEEGVELVTPIDDMVDEILDLNCACGDSLRKLIVAIEEGPLSRIPGVWQSIKGCQTLRKMAANATMTLNLPMLKYLMEMHKVPAHGCFQQERGDKKTIRNDDFYGPLLLLIVHVREKEESEEITSYLLSLPQIDVNERFDHLGSYPTTLVQLAARYGNLRVLRHMVLEWGADICAVDGEGCFPIYQAVYYTKVEAARFLLEQHRLQCHSLSDICNCPGDERAARTSLLHEPIRENDLAMVKMLIEEVGEGEAIMASRSNTYDDFEFEEKVCVYYLPIYANSLEVFKYFCTQNLVPKAVMGTCLTKALRMAKKEDQEEDEWLPMIEYIAEQLEPSFFGTEHWKRLSSGMHNMPLIHAHLMECERAEKARQAEAALLADLEGEEKAGEKKKEKNKKKQERRRAAAAAAKAREGQQQQHHQQQRRQQQHKEEKEDVKMGAAATTAMAALALEAPPAVPAEDKDKGEEGDKKEEKAGEEEEIGNEEEEVEEDDDWLVEAAPDGFKCPISHCLLVDPVIANDGHTYERKELEAWRANRAAKGLPFLSPKTNEELSMAFFPNHALRALVQDYVVKERSQRKEARKQQKQKKQGGLVASALGAAEAVGEKAGMRK